jgi:thiol-disulfide isomerase/thioredoxin
MKKMLMHAAVIAVIAVTMNYFVAFAAKTSPPVVGSVLPEIKLTVPADNDHKNYLGLSRGNVFKIPEIKANVVIIEIMNMYCPHCQASAPTVNEFYRIMENRPDLKDKIKLIGIAVGNSAYETGVFRKTFNVPFPLFPDGDYVIHNVMGGVRTPYFIGVKIDDGTPRVFYSKLGGFEKADQFLELMLKLSRLK